MLNDNRDCVSDCLVEAGNSGDPAASPGLAQSLANGRFAQWQVVTEVTEEEVMDLLTMAVLCPDREIGLARMRGLLDVGISAEDLIGRWIPIVARRFGEGWMCDGRSFADVTIGVARLQSWLRELERSTASDDEFTLNGPEVLLVVPQGSQHTLGAMVAMSLFRRLGAFVRLSLGQETRIVGHTVRRGRFDMVAISAAGSESLDFLATLVNSIRSGLAPSPAVVLGGEILNVNPDAAVLIGADHATSDPEEALTLCGLTRPNCAQPTVPTQGHHARGRPESVPITP